MSGAPFPYGETVTRLRRFEEVDPYSQQVEVAAWDDPDNPPYELEIAGCAFNPGVSSEPLDLARNAVITRPEVYAPAGSDVLAGDRLVVRELTYDVVGDPADFRSPFTGWAPGLVVRLERVDG